MKTKEKRKGHFRRSVIKYTFQSMGEFLVIALSWTIPGILFLILVYLVIHYPWQIIALVVVSGIIFAAISSGLEKAREQEKDNKMAEEYLNNLKSGAIRLVDGETGEETNYNHLLSKIKDSNIF